MVVALVACSPETLDWALLGAMAPAGMLAATVVGYWLGTRRRWRR
jgi:membrane protein DedA with SNARE-associated domain